MTLRCSSSAAFCNPIAHESMMAGWHWAQRNHWLREARNATGDFSFMRAEYIRNAKEGHREMMAHIRTAKKAGAK